MIIYCTFGSINFDDPKLLPFDVRIITVDFNSAADSNEWVCGGECVSASKGNTRKQGQLEYLTRNYCRFDEAEVCLEKI